MNMIDPIQQILYRLGIAMILNHVDDYGIEKIYTIEILEILLYILILWACQIHFLQRLFVWYK